MKISCVGGNFPGDPKEDSSHTQTRGASSGTKRKICSCVIEGVGSWMKGSLQVRLQCIIAKYEVILSMTWQ